MEGNCPQRQRTTCQFGKEKGPRPARTDQVFSERRRSSATHLTPTKATIKEPEEFAECMHTRYVEAISRIVEQKSRAKKCGDRE